MKETHCHDEIESDYKPGKCYFGMVLREGLSEEVMVQLRPERKRIQAWVKAGQGFIETRFGLTKIIPSRVNKCKSSGLGKSLEDSGDRKNAKKKCLAKDGEKDVS